MRHVYPNNSTGVNEKAHLGPGLVFGVVMRNLTTLAGARFMSHN